MICGKVGSIASIARAFSVIINAIIVTNSRGPRGLRVRGREAVLGRAWRAQCHEMGVRGKGASPWSSQSAYAEPKAAVCLRNDWMAATAVS